jgi:hypothetical protein
MNCEKQVLMKSIIKKIEEFENEFIYLKIFNILTENMKLQNFSDNRNGIFFELNTFEYSKLKEIDNKLSYYRDTSDNAKENNENREKLVDKMKKTVCSADLLQEHSGEGGDTIEENLEFKAYNDDYVQGELVEEFAEEECIEEEFDELLSDGELFGDSSDNELDE